MSTAIFLTPRGNGGGYDIQLGEDVHSRLPDGFHNLIVLDNYGNSRTASMSEGDWEQLRDHIDQLLNNR